MKYQVLIGLPNGSAGYAPGDVTVPVDAEDEDELTAALQAGVQIGERMPSGWARRRMVKAVVSEADHAASTG